MGRIFAPAPLWPTFSFSHSLKGFTGSWVRLVRSSTRATANTRAPGDITTTSGTLTGTLAEGTPLNIDFGRASTATITLVDVGRLDILRVDQTGSVIAYANIDDFITNQNGMALGPPVSDFATARGFFSVASKYYPVLGDGMIVEYPTALDFATDFNGTAIDTVPEYGTDVGYLGAAPSPVFPAPALSHSGRAALTAVLIGAAGWLFARRQSAGVVS